MHRSHAIFTQSIDGCDKTPRIEKENVNEAVDIQPGIEHELEIVMTTPRSIGMLLQTKRE